MIIYGHDEHLQTTPEHKLDFSVVVVVSNMKNFSKMDDDFDVWKDQVHTTLNI